MTEVQHENVPEAEVSPSDSPDVLPPRKRSRHRVLFGTLAAVVLLGGAGAGAWAVSTGALADSGQEAPRQQFATGHVVRGDLEESTSAVGTLRYEASRTIQAGVAGTVTGLPSPGTTASAGESLYSIDDVPVFLLGGERPAWRGFASGMDDGSDVQQLEEALSELGFFTGEPDEQFRWATTEAIMDWQESHGLDRTGELPFGSVVFADGDLRIGTATANVGDHVAAETELFQVSGTTQIVDVDLGLSDQQLAVLDTAVVVRLPGGEQTSGTIISVGTPTETESATGESTTVIPVVVALDNADAASAFQEASVTVDIPSQSREDVLSVPVGALLALTPDQFGVEVVDSDGSTRQVPVETGLFAGGRVEISGDDVSEGTEVVVPSR
ncbi:efflux RND transporter periplasmic adaptor subunit [Ruania halotolerans]|uniref:efflux RND transporter periplasmic adaptor subunit n=1 Tax=Ruania halotolerans TaxID=2897773 RepID=UPI001E32EEB2|nr:peptidoglycan-binding protein [Ruania halotolerans]UFU05452.1 peptidoglycan-binding protein [Ruania halotolerans]